MNDQSLQVGQSAMTSPSGRTRTYAKATPSPRGSQNLRVLPTSYCQTSIASFSNFCRFGHGCAFRLWTIIGAKGFISRQAMI